MLDFSVSDFYFISCFYDRSSVFVIFFRGYHLESILRGNHLEKGHFIDVNTQVKNVLSPSVLFSIYSIRVSYFGIKQRLILFYNTSESKFFLMAGGRIEPSNSRPHALDMKL